MNCVRSIKYSKIPSSNNLLYSQTKKYQLLSSENNDTRVIRQNLQLFASN